MEAGRAYRKFMSYFGYSGSIALFVGVLVLIVEFSFPGFFIGGDSTLLGILEFLLVYGTFGTLFGASHGFQTLSARHKAVKRIKNLLAEFGLDSLQHQQTQPAFLLADSIDREVLATIREIGGNIIDLEERLTKRGLIPKGATFYRRIAKLHLAGLLSLDKETDSLFLTSTGLDALNTPSVLFVSRIPNTVWNYVFQAKTHLWLEKWGIAVVEGSKALEATLRDRLCAIIEQQASEWERVSSSLPKRPLDKWSAGALLGALREMGFVKTGSFEDSLIGELVKLRNLVHDKAGSHTFGPSDADKLDTYLGLLLRNWYGPK